MATKTFIFAGASSKIAIETSLLLRNSGHKVIGISTKTHVDGYDRFFTVEKYTTGGFPAIEEGISGIVYFPGTINLKPFNRLSLPEFVQDYEINSLGAVAFTQAYLANLKKSEAASIVYISTVAVSVGMPFHASIAMAKGAIEGLTKSLAAELAPLIRVNCVAPSLTDTSLSEKFLNSPEKIVSAQNRNPLKKVGSALDIANAVDFLLNEKSAWVTGHIFSVDGGMGNLKPII